MANGKIRFGKQSGGQLALIMPDGTTNTEVIVPESGVLATKEYIDNTTVKLTGNQTISGIKTFSSTIDGNSATSTKLHTPVNINGVSFDGSSDITVRDATAVKLTENQTIDGIKTFSLSPIVPTPTTNTQAANKQYVDSKTLDINSLPNKPTPIDTDNLVLQETGGLLKKLSFSTLRTTFSFNGEMSLTKNGYIKFPTAMGGLIIQWGRTSFIGQTSETLNFPIAFPNNVFSVSTGEQQSTDSAVSRTYYSSTKTAITITRDTDGKVSGLISVNYIAIGN